MRVLAIDPGANPGFCLTEVGVITECGPTFAADILAPIDELVVEDQFAAATMYRDGKRVRISRKSQMTLARTAGILFERYDATRKYRISPDDWRAVLWPGARRVPKKVVLARLTPAFGHMVADLPKKNQPDVLEAIGIACAWSKLTPGEKVKYLVKQ